MGICLGTKTVKVSNVPNEVITPVETASVSQSVCKEGDIFSPMNGEVVKLSDVPDPVFSGGTMGSGIAINPSVISALCRAHDTGSWRQADCSFICTGG